jgi:septum formation protein
MTPTFILASTSPRRRELFALAGWSFETKPASIDETPLPGEIPADYVLRLAVTKAREVAGQAQSDQLVLAADTIVADGDTLLGKPVDARQAAAMLVRLHGRVHQVYTAIALLDPASGALMSDLCVSQVPMRAYSYAEMEAYIATGDPLDKAGAYAIQHAGFHPVEKFAGCFASVMGLPLCHIARTLQKMGVNPNGRDVAQACQAHLGYICPIFKAVLNGENVG